MLLVCSIRYFEPNRLWHFPVNILWVCVLLQPLRWLCVWLFVFIRSQNVYKFHLFSKMVISTYPDRQIDKSLVKVNILFPPFFICYIALGLVVLIGPFEWKRKEGSEEKCGSRKNRWISCRMIKSFLFRRWESVRTRHELWDNNDNNMWKVTSFESSYV